MHATWHCKSAMRRFGRPRRTIKGVTRVNDIMGIDQTGLGPNDSASETEGFDRSATGIGSRSIVGSLAVLLILAGSCMQGYANGTVDAFFVALLLFIAGVLCPNLSRRAKGRALCNGAVVMGLIKAWSA